MIKLIIGKKGSGKTKALIEMVNSALAVTKGSVVCIEKATSSSSTSIIIADLSTLTTILSQTVSHCSASSPESLQAIMT